MTDYGGERPVEVHPLPDASLALTNGCALASRSSCPNPTSRATRCAVLSCATLGATRPIPTSGFVLPRGRALQPWPVHAGDRSGRAGATRRTQEGGEGLYSEAHISITPDDIMTGSGDCWRLSRHELGGNGSGRAIQRTGVGRSRRHFDGRVREHSERQPEQRPSASGRRLPLEVFQRVPRRQSRVASLVDDENSLTGGRSPTLRRDENASYDP